MTFRGIFITVLELFLVILALGTDIREFLVIALCVGGIVVYSLVSLLIAALTLGVKSKLNSTEVYRGQKINYTLFLKGVVLLPVVGYLSVKTADFEVSKKDKFKHSFLIMPSFSINRKFRFELSCSHVGLWNVGIKKLRFEDLFGLFSLPLIRTNKGNYIVRLAVVPNLHNFDEFDMSASSGGYGSSSSVNSEEGELLGDSRIYMEGDSLKRINWKLSARTKTLYSRQYERLEKPHISIVVDRAISNSEIGDAIDIACETAISLSNYFVDNDHVVELVLIRSDKELENNYSSLTDKISINKMQYAFSAVEFFKYDNPLYMSDIGDRHFLESDKLYFITTNPSKQLLSDMAGLSKGGQIAKCIIPETDIINRFEDDDICVIVNSTSQIPKKVGEVL